MLRKFMYIFLVLSFILGGSLVLAADEQESVTPPAPGFKLPPPTPNDTLVSPEIAQDGRVTLRIYAPEAEKVSARGDLIPWEGPPFELTKDNQGVWSRTTDPVAVGTYRYTFVVDGVSTIDPRNTNISTTNSSVMSLLRVIGPGSAFEDTRDVPHGAVAKVFYPSSYGYQRRMHVYTPPGYEKGCETYPVLYLLHGGGDHDASWSTVGRAGFILDNLIAAGKVKPMLMVMPSGHSPGSMSSVSATRSSSAMGAGPEGDPFSNDLLESIIPYIEKSYRVSKQAKDRALAGLSMGGIQTANIGLVHSDMFPFMGIFSSGWFPPVRTQFAEKHGTDLDTASKNLKLMWVAWGKKDIANENSKAMLKLFDEHGIKYMPKETPGGHTWNNWRKYLNEFAPLLFK